MTYYGYRVSFRFTFECGCTEKKRPIFEKFAYQYAGLGRPQSCPPHGSPERGRVVTKLDGPHGHHELGWWKRDDGTGLFLIWSPQTKWVSVWDRIGHDFPPDWPEGDFVQIQDQEQIWGVVGGGTLGGDRPEHPDEILAKFRAAVGGVQSPPTTN